MTSPIRPARYEGVYAEAPPEYQVLRHDAAGQATDEVVISVPTLDASDRVLVIEYRVLVPELEGPIAIQLIIDTLLSELLIDSLRADADTIDFHDLATGARRTLPYPMSPCVVPVTMSLIVLRVRDLEASRSFYTALGLQFVSEQHETGPLHYSCTMRPPSGSPDMVVELYPATATAPPTCVRLGLRHASAAIAIERLHSSGLLREPPQILRIRSRSTVYLVRDPDDNSIELELFVSPSP